MIAVRDVLLAVTFALFAAAWWAGVYISVPLFGLLLALSATCGVFAELISFMLRHADDDFGYGDTVFGAECDAFDAIVAAEFGGVWPREAGAPE